MKTFAELYDSLRDTQKYQVEQLTLAFTESVLLRMEALSNLTGKELAKRMGCSKAYVSKLLSGKGNFTHETLVKLARALDCRVEPPRLIPNETSQVIRFGPPVSRLVYGEFRPLTKEQKPKNDHPSNPPAAA